MSVSLLLGRGTHRARSACLLASLAGLSIVAGGQDVGPGATWTPQQRNLITWGYAVREWIEQAPTTWQAQLVRGALLECLAATAGRDAFPVDMLSEDDGVRCRTRPPIPTDRPGFLSATWRIRPVDVTGCRKAATSAYGRVLARNPASDEAQLRRAAMDALDARTRPGQDNPHLVDLAATSSTRQVKFLALLVLGLGAERRNDLSTARTRYEAARGVGPDWLSAQHALASILLQQGQTALARDSLPAARRPDASDPWYGYPCQIITPAVLAELRERQARVRRP